MSSERPDLTPNPILAEPATVAACQRDYAQAADVRDRMDQQDHQPR